MHGLWFFFYWSALSVHLNFAPISQTHESRRLCVKIFGYCCSFNNTNCTVHNKSCEISNTVISVKAPTDVDRGCLWKTWLDSVNEGIRSLCLSWQDAQCYDYNEKKNQAGNETTKVHLENGCQNDGRAL